MIISGRLFITIENPKRIAKKDFENIHKNLKQNERIVMVDSLTSNITVFNPNQTLSIVIKEIVNKPNMKLYILTDKDFYLPI